MRIYLSPPDVGDLEREFLLDAFDSNWIAPTGPHVDAFEDELAARAGTAHAVALASGTAGLHLALRELGVGPGDIVVCPTLTFVATANAVRYCGAEPVLVDVDADTWTVDPALVAAELQARAAAGRPAAAVVTVDLYGQCADHPAIQQAAASHGVPVVEDAAEALGATHGGRPAGSFGRAGVLSFNGNKIITTSGGGAVVTDDGRLADRVRHLATQAREPAPHYQHVEVGYNARLSNLLAALGRAQLRSLDDKVAARRRIRRRYREALADLPGVAFMQAAPGGRPTWWLTCLTVDPDAAGTDREQIRRRLVDRGIEARPVWKPMHLQPVYADADRRGGQVAADLFATGLCLPSGSGLTDAEQDEIVTTVRAAFPAAG